LRSNVPVCIAVVRRLRWAGPVPVLLGFPVANVLGTGNVIVGKIDTVHVALRGA
jgi:hypothetical protein